MTRGLRRILKPAPAWAVVYLALQLGVSCASAGGVPCRNAGGTRSSLGCEWKCTADVVYRIECEALDEGGYECACKRGGEQVARFASPSFCDELVGAMAAANASCGWRLEVP